MNATIEKQIEAEVIDPCPTIAYPKIGCLERDLTARQLMFMCLDDVKQYIHGLRQAGEINPIYGETCKEAAENLERILRLAMYRPAFTV